MTIHEIIDETIKLVEKSTESKEGGPFGAAIFNEKEIVCVCTNKVLQDKDPTAHAEIVAIREACKKLNTIDLSNYSIYATGFPCPMCMSAILWAGIKMVYFSQNIVEATKIGFKDEGMYKDVSDITEFLKLDTNCLGFEGINSQDKLYIHRIKDEKLDYLYNKYKQEGELY